MKGEGEALRPSGLSRSERVGFFVSLLACIQLSEAYVPNHPEFTLLGGIKCAVKSSTSLILWIVSCAVVVLIAYVAGGSQLALAVFVAWLVARLFRDIGWFMRLNDKSKGQKHDDERK